jgi:purine nucleosidase
MKRILIDTDIGSDIDDALALLLALNLNDLDIIGISTVYGPVETCAKIAHKIVSAAGRSIPIAAGISEPIHSFMPVWVAGTEGKGVLTEEDKNASLSDLGIETEAVEKIITWVLKYSGDISLLALGPLTNIAHAIKKEPALVVSLKEIVFMGGGLTYPRPVPDHLVEGAVYRSRHSHNILCDMVAAQQVLDSDLPMRIVTNDATCQLWLEGAGIERFQTTTLSYAKIVGQMLDVWLKYRTDIFNQPIKGTCPHDAFTLAVALNRVRYSSCRGVLEVDYNDAGTMFELNVDSQIELVISEMGNQFIPWLTKHLHEPV